MEESDDYWMKLFEEFGPLTAPLSSGEESGLDDVPKWVTKVQFQLGNLLAPKLQFKAGMKMNADKLGVFVGFNLFQCTQALSAIEAPRPAAGPGLDAFMQGAKIAGGSPEILMRDDNSKRITNLQQGAKRIVARVLEEKPLIEAVPFFKGLARGMQGSGIGLIPRFVNGVPQYTPRQMQAISTVIIYSVVLREWRAIDSLQTSAEAYDYLGKRIPPEVLGFDPERIRALFKRVGKSFKAPGRPSGR
jgi:hypothetical protein